MSIETITATEAARKFSEILNRVRYQGQTFEIRRGRHIIARIGPTGTPRSVKASELPEIFASLPKLESEELEAFEQDLLRVRSELVSAHNPWD